MNNLNKIIDKNKILLDNNLLNGGNINYNFLIKLTKLYNKYAVDEIYIHNNITKNELLNNLIYKLSDKDDNFFNKIFINKNDLINYINKYNIKNKDEIKYNKNNFKISFIENNF